MKKHTFKFYNFILLALALILTLNPLLTYADDLPDYEAEAEARKNEPVESNSWESWPDGPLIGAESAILMDADTGEILYAKNIDERLYPASTTKLMTCLVAVENAELDEMVTISQAAIDANEWDGSNMGLTAGEQLTVEELIQGMLITSANEACNAIGEHIAGSMDAYVDMMNEKAEELGLENTHFVTTNGLQDENHYTSARDLAIIATEFFKYDILCKYSSKTGAYFEANEYHNEHEFYSKNKLYKNRDYEYEYLVGSKTGYTGAARQTLVSCAEKDGIRLICVIMKEESPYQFEDTVNLFEYGFNNFQRVNITTNETRYNMAHSDFFMSENDPIMYIDPDASVLIPVGVDFSELTSSIDYENATAPYFGTINYYFHDAYVGSAGIAFKEEVISYDSFSEETPAEAQQKEEELKKQQILIDVKKIFTVVFILIGLAVLAFVIISILKRFHFSGDDIVSPGLSLKNTISKKRRDIRKNLRRRKKHLKPRKVKSEDLLYTSQGKKNKSRKATKNRPKKPVNRNNFNFDDFNL